jgi:hypothetical protein
VSRSRDRGSRLGLAEPADRRVDEVEELPADPRCVELEALGDPRPPVVQKDISFAEQSVDAAAIAR